MTTSKPTVRYYVTVKGNEHIVDLTESADGLAVTFDGREVSADLQHLAGRVLHSILIDGLQKCLFCGGLRHV